MTDRTLTAMCDTRDAAENARQQLVGLGIPSGQVAIHGGETGTTAETTKEEPGFWASLFLPDDDRQLYAEGARRGGYLLTARVGDDLEEAALDVLEGSGAVDLDTQAETWRQEGWRGNGAARGTAGADSSCPVLPPPRAWPGPTLPIARSRAPRCRARRARRWSRPRKKSCGSASARSVVAGCGCAATSPSARSRSRSSCGRSM